MLNGAVPQMTERSADFHQSQPEAPVFSGDLHP